ncbi:hypothetical protein [Paraflavitalea speifideaquila]|uniref:hypothetical protein n=1 Tax=Paraflavitalea speifideaquila TaxID=3076558 RepID=UPI0028EE40B7|nr:hypothetical protein [Paraflavitalea speifideiaquila]
MRILCFWVLCCLASPAATLSQCPHIAGIMVDACGLENNNEFIFLRTGSNPVNVNDIGIALPANGNITVANLNDFSPPDPSNLTPWVLV